MRSFDILLQETGAMGRPIPQTASASEWAGTRNGGVVSTENRAVKPASNSTRMTMIRIRSFIQMLSMSFFNMRLMYWKGSCIMYFFFFKQKTAYEMIW